MGQVIQLSTIVLATPGIVLWKKISWSLNDINIYNLMVTVEIRSIVDKLDLILIKLYLMEFLKLILFSCP